MKQETIKKILAIFAFVFISISGFHSFCSFPIISINILTSRIKGFYLALIFVCLCIYVIWANKKTSFYVLSTLAICSCAYTFYNLYKIYDASLIRLGVGFYEYALGALVLVINLCIPWKTDVKEKTSASSSKLDAIEKKALEDSLYGFYVYGLAKAPTMKPCVLQNDRENKTVSIFIANQEVVSTHQFQYTEIQKISFSSRPLVDQKPRLAEDYQAENAALSHVLLGLSISSYALKGVLNELIQGYDKVRIKMLFQIVLEYKIGEETKQVLIETYKNPSSFIDSILVANEKD